MSEHRRLEAFPQMEVSERVDRAEAFYAHYARRRTVRDFSDAPVPRAVIEAAIRVAGTAPNGANHQPWYFCAISDANTKRAIRKAAEAEERAFYDGRAGQDWLDALSPLGTDAEKSFLETAPWLIAVFAQRRGGPHPGDNLKNYYVSESVGIAVGLLVACLHDAGLATLTHTPAPMGFLREICGRPETEKPFVLLVVGHAADETTYPVSASMKKSLGEIATFI